MELRPAQPDDALEVAGVHVRSWQAAYRGLMPDAYLDGLRPEDRATRYTFDVRTTAAPWTMVAVVEGRICGFATSGPTADEDSAGTGELMALYADPARWSTGAGRALMEATRHELVDRGFTDALLWVLSGNARATRFHERDGWHADGSTRTAEVWGVPVDEQRYRRALT